MEFSGQSSWPLSTNESLHLYKYIVSEFTSHYNCLIYLLILFLYRFRRTLALTCLSLSPMKLVSLSPLKNLFHCSFLLCVELLLFCSFMDSTCVQTCLSKGQGYHFPPCHILNICGFQVLFDCPLDLSALSVFSPLPTDPPSLLDRQIVPQTGKCLDATSLIHSEPWYKTVERLNLFNTSFIDVVLITSPMGLLGLPYLTRDKDFSAKVIKIELVT